MKISREDQQKINDFTRNYVDRSYRMVLNAVRLSSQHTDQHRRMIFEVCDCLLKLGVPFYTEVKLRCGCIPDICVPTYIVPFIEVLSSETPQMFESLKLHKYPAEFQEKYNNGKLKSFIMVEADSTFDPEMIT